MKFSWSNLEKPVFILAPMEDVTDCAFREMFAKYGKPDILFTEFVSVDGLMHPEGRKKLSIDLKFTEIQRPMIAQIWGADPEKFRQAAEYVASLGFDGIDINMGCPQTKEIAVGACAALIRTPKLAQEIIHATKKGAGGLPVSVKTRIGYSKTEEMEEWMKYLLDTDIEALTLHARTKKEMSKVPAHWEKITEAVEVRNREKSKTLIIGNGDIKTREEGLARIQETGCDGIMVGRGAFGNPWWFKKIEETNPQGVLPSTVAEAPVSFLQRSDSREVNSTTATHINIPTYERLRVMLEHAELFDKMFSGVKSFSVMRKHFKAYASGFEGASELRAKLMDTKDLAETKHIVKEFLAQHVAADL